MRFTLTVHDWLAFRLPPVRFKTVSPVAGTQLPPHVVVAPGVVATASPVRLSENPRPVKSPTEFGLVRVNVTVEIGGMAPPVRRGIKKGLKTSLIVGGAKTATVAVEVFPNPSVGVCAAKLLVLMPRVAPIKFVVSVHELEGPRLTGD